MRWSREESQPSGLCGIHNVRREEGVCYFCRSFGALELVVATFLNWMLPCLVLMAACNLGGSVLDQIGFGR